MGKIVLTQALLVEGRYDKAKLDALIHGLILPVHGFSLFTDQPLQRLIRQLGDTQGLVVLTDSDSAGFKIRGFINGLVPTHQITHVYIPDVVGKEKRKSTPSKEGTLGVEGLDLPLLCACFEQAGLLPQEGPVAPATHDAITKGDYYTLGLTGGPDSKKLRQRLFKRLDLPEKMSTNQSLQVLNQLLTLKELVTLMKELD